MQQHSTFRHESKYVAEELMHLVVSSSSTDHYVSKGTLVELGQEMKVAAW